MSSPQNGRNMDRQLPPGGSVRRARERAMAGLPREDFSSLPAPDSLPRGLEQPQVAPPSAPRRPAVGPMGPPAGQSRIPRPPPPPGLQTKDGQIGVAISRPTQIPQWPLQAPVTALTTSDAGPYRPPLGTQPPPRPPRPSRIPSILDSSKVQDPTPVFQYRSQPARGSTNQDMSPTVETPTSISRPSTLSSIASIPDFPIPQQAPAGLPRRSVNLGPPPSARRGALSFYSNTSYVSPIPEESPRTRSRASYASSAAMPESWGTPSPGPSPAYPGAFYDDIIVEESVPSAYGDEDAEESRLVRSASIGKRARPTLVSSSTARAVEADEPNPSSNLRPGPRPVQSGPFTDGTGYIEGSSSSGTLPVAQVPIMSASAIPTADSILDAYSAASTTDPSNPPGPGSRSTPSPPPPIQTPGGRPYSRLSAIRRPPRLDIDAVRKAESRGSLTSLPDLIRRATRLAASLEKGRRPASRFEDLGDYPDLAYGPGARRDRDREMSFDAEKYQSGFSDMLAAFPPPAQAASRRSFRNSFRNSFRQQTTSWPLPHNVSSASNASRGGIPPLPASSSTQARKGRRCCGLPLWGFILVVIIVLVLIAAAIIIPLEFFVIRKQNVGTTAQSELEQCQQQINCANGGSNVVNEGICSCICTGGFTGFDCTVSPGAGCTTTSLTGDSNMSNVTLGDAIPRLIEQAQANFSIPLSATIILARLNAGNLSCSAENALVTFDGESTRQGDGSAQVTAAASSEGLVAVNGAVVVKVTVMAESSTTFTVKKDPFATSPLVSPTGGESVALGAYSSQTVGVLPTTTTTVTTTITPTVYTTTTTTSTAAAATTSASSKFTVTEEVLDFARVAVLYVLQQESLTNAETAQVSLQKFFTSAGSTTGNGATVSAAQNVSIGDSNMVDLIHFLIDTGLSSNGTVGGTGSTKARSLARHPFMYRRSAFDVHNES